MKTFLASAAKILALVLICLAAGFCIVFPLWKWATVSPTSYTWVILALALCAFIYWQAKSCIRLGWKRFLFRWLKILTAAGGIAACVFLVLHMHRILALLPLLAAAAIYALLHKGASGLEK